MSAIGDYIYLQARNYKKYGKPETFNPTAYLDSVKAKALRNSKMSMMGVDPASLQQLALDVSAMVNQGTDKEFYSKVKNEVNNAMATKFQNKLNKEFTSNYEDFWKNKGHISSSSSIQSIGKVGGEGEYRTTVSKILSTYQRIQNNLLALSEGGKIEHIQQLKSAQVLCEMLLYEVQNGITKDASKLDLDINLLNSVGSRFIKQGGVIKTLNRLTEIWRTIPSVSDQKGKMFEMTVESLKSHVGYIAKEDLSKNMKQLTGSQGEAVAYRESNFFKNFKPTFGTYTEYLGEGAWVTNSNSQQKSDINITWMNKNGPTVTSRFSLKNTSGVTKPLKLVEGTSLLYILQDEDASFVNHYLNLTAIRDAYKDDEAIQKTFQTKRNEAIKVVQLISAYKAISGSGFGRQPVDFLLINRAGKVSIINIGLAIEKALESSNPSQYFYFGPEYLYQDFKNEKIGHKLDINDAFKRISILLNDVHSRKLTILSKSSLESLGNIA